LWNQHDILIFNTNYCLLLPWKFASNLIFVNFYFILLYSLFLIRARPGKKWIEKPLSEMEATTIGWHHCRDLYGTNRFPHLSPLGHQNRYRYDLVSKSRIFLKPFEFSCHIFWDILYAYDNLPQQFWTHPAYLLRSNWGSPLELFEHKMRVVLDKVQKNFVCIWSTWLSIKRYCSFFTR